MEKIKNYLRATVDFLEPYSTLISVILIIALIAGIIF